MTRDTTGGAILRTIAAYGIDTVFGIPGTHNLEFYRPIRELGIRPVTARHEQGAGYAADGWSQRTGRPGVVITTSGPGLLNVLSAAGTAFCESRPMLILSPGIASGTTFEDRGVLHESKDPSAAANGVVLWSRRVADADAALDAVHEAFALFAAGRPRPVHIEVPLDVLEAEHEFSRERLAPRTHALVEADAASVDAAIAAIRGAKRPVIIAGGGAIAAGDAVRRLAEVLQAPVVTTLNGKATIPESHDLSLRSELRLAATADVVRAADVLIVIGSKLGEAELWGNDVTPSGTVVRIDLDATRVHTNMRADIAVVGDSRTVIPRMVEGLAGLGTRTVHVDVGAVREAQSAEAHTFAPVVMAAANAIDAAIPGGATVSGDSSQITYYGMTSVSVQDRPHSFLYMPAYATLGYGLPAAIGAAIAEPETPVVSVLGDGALMFSVQEFATAVEQGVDLTVVCVDNGGYREIRENETDRGITPVGVDLRQPDWAALVEAFGGHGHRVSDVNDLTSTVAAAIDEAGVSLVHVPLSLFETKPAVVPAPTERDAS